MTKQYRIDELLAHGEQPFDDLDGEALTALAKGIGKERALTVPVVLTADGVLVDGHQRLRAMQLEGRKVIEASDVRFVEGDALEWSVRLNVQRRQLSLDEKAAVARKLAAERGWSQRKIADLFGVSQPAVSQWFKADPDRNKRPGRRPGPRTPTPAVLAETKRLAAEATNPALAQWIAEHIEEGDRAEVIKLWRAIEVAAGSVVETLEATEGGDDDAS